MRSGSRLALLLLTAALPLQALGWRSSYLAASPLALALAGGGTAWMPDAYLIEINPAHVWGVDGESIGYGHLRMFGNLGGHVVTWQGALRGRPTQFRLRTLAEDDIELRGDVPTAEPLGTFGARLIEAELSRGWMLGTLQVGVSLTAAYQRIFEYDGRGVWLSAGLLGNLGSRVRWGLSVSHIGVGEGPGTSDLASQLWRLQGGVMLKLLPLFGQIGIDAGFDSRSNVLTGVVWQTGTGPWQVCLGLRQVAGEYRLGLGFGLSHERWRVAYAYSYQGRTLGQPQMIQVSRQL